MDNRASVRVSVELDAELRVGQKAFSGTVLNCSLSGIFLRTHEKLEAGDVLEVRIILPEILDPIQTNSRVIWTDWSERYPPGFGIHFLSLTDEQVKVLRDFLYE